MATLSRRVGVEHVQAAEDAAQAALMSALETWPRSGLPENPSAWLFRVAHNQLLDQLRQASGRRRILDEQRAAEPAPVEPPTEAPLAGEVHNDLLRMLFVCCDEGIAPDSQLVLALKTLCGFDVREIALRLFTTEANVYKRLGRARERLRQLGTLPELGSGSYAPRLTAVRRVLYLLFTEGYLSSHADHAIRDELCGEALRLTTALVEHPVGQTPESYALLALMHLHAARRGARQDAAGGLLLLEEQDRALWDVEQVQLGLEWLARSASGEVYSRYHAEAAIAAEHCLAPSFDETRWGRIAECYELLERVSPSPLHRLNRAVAVAEWQGAAAGLAVIEGFEPPAWLEGSYLWAAVLADLHRRAGNGEAAERHMSAALELAPTEAVRGLLRRRLGGEQR